MRRRNHNFLLKLEFLCYNLSMKKQAKGIIEKAKIEDYKEVVHLFNELFEVLVKCNPKKFTPLKEGEVTLQQKDFEDSLKEGAWRNFELYKIDGKIVGLIDYAIYDTSNYPGYIPCKLCMLGNIVVKKEYRGMGIGTQCINYLRQKCKDQNIQRFELEMEKANKAAFKFYKKLGLKEERIRFAQYF